MMGATDWLGAGARIGDYVVERELAAKPGLVAWSATHSLLPRRARISTVHLAFVEVPGVGVQLTREACLLEALRHPGVPRVFECGLLPDRRPWVASELIEGSSLASLLAEEGRLGVLPLLALLAEVSEILHHVHTRGLVHRNLRPEAITRRPEGPCIVDWGDARGRDEGALARVSRDRAGYQPPEVLAGDPADSRADVFALGVIACEALAGVRTARATALRFPASPARLTALLDRMLARDPLVRPTSAEVRVEARAIAEQLAASAPPPVDDDGADVQIEEVELGAALAAEADPDPDLPADFSQRAPTRTMPAVDLAISATRTVSMSAVEIDAMTRTRRMPAVDELELDEAMSNTTRMPAVDEPELEAPRTKTETMPPDGQPVSRTKTEPMPSEPEPEPEPEPAPDPPPRRSSTRIGKLALPSRILERTRTKTS